MMRSPPIVFRDYVVDTIVPYADRGGEGGDGLAAETETYWLRALSDVMTSILWS
jgi:hypothetical protein